jgi:YggT family protein
MSVIASLLTVALWFLVIAVLIRVVYSWMSPQASNPVTRFAFQVTEPVLAPVRRLLPPVSGLDLSPLVVTVVCYFLIHVLGTVG